MHLAEHPIARCCYSSTYSSPFSTTACCISVVFICLSVSVLFIAKVPAPQLLILEESKSSSRGVVVPPTRYYHMPQLIVVFSIENILRDIPIFMTIAGRTSRLR